jgi:hypothetical protein
VLRCSIAVGLVAGCGQSSVTTCTHDEDCASHFCKADGTCGPAGTDAPLGSDAQSDAPPGVCTPDHDGHITAAELPLVAGRSATFKIATDATWSTIGASNPDNTRHWSLTGALANDADRAIALMAPGGAWWAADFTSATYAVPLAADSDLLGVFHVASDRVELLGVVSPDAGATRTELTYDPPARILTLPFASTSTWSSTSSVSGLAQGVIVAYTEKYASLVDQSGTMTTPYGDFPVLRVATDLTRTSGITLLLSNRTFAWVAECFGTVATVRSQDFETNSEFSSDAEVRRLTP